jgi:hypothetical protein
MISILSETPENPIVENKKIVLKIVTDKDIAKTERKRLLNLDVDNTIDLEIVDELDVERTTYLMYDGTSKAPKDLVIGDVLMADDCTPCTIINVTKTKEKNYLVKPVKGDSYLVGESNILSLSYSGNPHMIWCEDRKSYRVKWFDKIHMESSKSFSVKVYGIKEEAYRAGEEFKSNILIDNDFKLSVKEYLKEKSLKNRYKAYKVKLDFPHNNFEIDPYIIGFWLGDGSAASPSITTIDPEIIDFFTDYFSDFNLLFKLNPNDITYRITSGKHGGINYPGKNRFLEYLREKNLLDNKHIPLEFIMTSRENRLRLLAGLLDSDGSLDKSNCYDFIQKREKLFDQFIFLCRSLGFACYKNPCVKVCTNSSRGRVAGTYYRCAVSGEGLEEIPTLLARKTAHERKQIKRVYVTGITLEDVGIQSNYRIVTDKPRFLLTDLTVVHRYEFRL